MYNLFSRITPKIWCPLSRLILYVWFILREVDWFSLISVIALLCFAPFIVFYFVMACDQYQCSISQPLFELYQGETTLLSIWARAPSFTWSAAKIYSIWVAFQVKDSREKQDKRRGGRQDAGCSSQKVLSSLKLKQAVLSLRCSCICVFLMSHTNLFLAMLVVCRMEHELLLVMNTHILTLINLLTHSVGKTLQCYTNLTLWRGWIKYWNKTNVSL